MEATEHLEVVMSLIMHGGDAKGKAVEAIRAAKQYDFELAEAKLKEAHEALNTAHRSQTNLLTQEASGDAVAVSLLMVHGQDHLMTALTFIDLAKELVEVYRELERK
ncbi:PTS lactose/cellobiose transporter subunit IIA [Aerococcaceae bacterium NML191292]|nr:PTS lactose/cellobiose transporter subunit IIA [Aerococcaceae bacterium NML210727]MCW6654786.1 PTS lactose/cellobiose transporter subunit IIA [Aerococcaceae bacterium NML201296]MCW6659237.1 PTS lactose/cellobiose transporter subunit IIA [Aerococcaceae bacterium NML191292]MCW6661291.1 PTS lactose/cellobiose transporter subunit IIA [Aerococcaceae bacterium NML201209]MCW6662569.1 PTS lactose/cellobiose transporter subunit IIA [Aerococcaceae bacterium NML190073]MCW6664620.1 PTS lactose/cellobio